MEPERYRRVKQILDTALDLDPGQRRSFLENECGADVELHHAVESLVEKHIRAQSVLE